MNSMALASLDLTYEILTRSSLDILIVLNAHDELVLQVLGTLVVDV